MVVVGRLLAVVAVLLAAGLSVKSVGWAPEPYDRIEPLGTDRLRVTWSGGACDDAWRVDVHESEDVVRLTVWTQVLATGCNDMEVERSEAVELDAPLAGRAVVNAACERERFADRSACQAATP